jgi:hypothetical protein
MSVPRQFGFLTSLFIATALFWSSVSSAFLTYQSNEIAKTATASYIPARVSVDLDALFGADQAKRLQAMNVTLPSGKSYSVSSSNVLNGLNGGKTFVGYFDELGEHYRIYITETQGEISGLMFSPEGILDLSSVVGATTGRATLTSRGAAGQIKAQHFGSDAKPLPEAELAARLNRLDGNSLLSEQQLKAAVERAKAGTQVTVDILVTYTAGMITRHANAAGVLARINTLVATMNDALAQSQVNLTIQLVNATRVTYSDSGTNDAALTAISPASPNPIKATMDGLRNQYGADLVVLLRPYERATHSGCGLAWVLGFGASGVSAADAPYGFSAISDGVDVGNTGYYCDDLTFSHELGHNMGLSHDRANAGGIVGATNYAYGYINSAAGFGTIMSYASNRVTRFSNPNILCLGVPCGIVRTDTANSADAAGAILTTMDAVAAFRASVLPGTPMVTGVTSGDAQVSVAFTPPASTGGTAIIGYSATCGTVTVTGTASPIVVSPLTNGVAVTCTVKATNSVGTGLASMPSNNVTPLGPPGAPTIGAVTAGNGQVSVAFTAPASNGGSAIIGYSATCGSVTVSGATSPIVVSPLTNGTAVTCTVKAINVIGPSVASAASASVTPATIPGAPTIGAVAAGNAQVSVAFTAPASNGGSAITDYSATCGSVTVNGATSPIVVSPLTNGTAVTCTVKANNAVGPSGASGASTSVTPATVPSAPTIGAVTAGNGQVSVTFTASASNGGSAITGYSATCGSVTVNGATSPIVVSPLPNGTAVTCTVKANNVIGPSVASAASASVTPTAPATVPGAPTIGAVTPGNAQVSVAFTAPASNGGSAIIDYSATCDAITVNGASSPIVVSPLTNGTAVTCTVKANNAVGSSVASAASASVTPATVPGAPTIGAVTAGNGQVSVAFTAPASNGGSAITGYSATCGAITVNGATSPIVVSPLTNGTAVTCTVKANNAVGPSAASAASASVTPVAPPGVPGAPTIGTVTAGNALVSVAFTAPASNGGSAITDYSATCGSVTVNGPTSPIIVSPLPNGTAVTCTVKANNSVGPSAASAASASVTPAAPATVPSAPTITAVTPGSGNVSVAFTPPSSSGGSAITGYTATCGGVSAMGPSSPVVVGPLPNGVTVTCSVVASNASGSGAVSAASGSVAPLAAGVCGPANGGTYGASPPTALLCTEGVASLVSGNGPWTWQCTSSTGVANCSAQLLAPGGCNCAGPGGLANPGTDFAAVAAPDVSRRGIEQKVAQLLRQNAETAKSAAATKPTRPEAYPWVVSHTADLDGDGVPDLLWRNAITGRVSASIMKAGKLAEQGVALDVDPNWQIAFTADLNGDGKQDLVWRNTVTGASAVWLMVGLKAIEKKLLTEDPNWEVTTAADLTGDGRADLIWTSKASGAMFVTVMRGVHTESYGQLLPAGTQWKIAHLADLNGDGKVDIVWRDGLTGDYAVWLMDGFTATHGFKLSAESVLKN